MPSYPATNVETARLVARGIGAPEPEASGPQGRPKVPTLSSRAETPESRRTSPGRRPSAVRDGAPGKRRAWVSNHRGSLEAAGARQGHCRRKSPNASRGSPKTPPAGFRGRFRPNLAKDAMPAGAVGPSPPNDSPKRLASHDLRPVGRGIAAFPSRGDGPTLYPACNVNPLPFRPAEDAEGAVGRSGVDGACGNRQDAL
jgi:hypothetical protein